MELAPGPIANCLLPTADCLLPGLTIKAKLDEKIYLTGIKVTEQEKEKLNILRNDFHGDWNYIISPNL